MEHVQQIAHEFFGVDSFYYNQYYDKREGIRHSSYGLPLQFYL